VILVDPPLKSNSIFLPAPIAISRRLGKLRQIRNLHSRVSTVVLTPARMEEYVDRDLRNPDVAAFPLISYFIETKWFTEQIPEKPTNRWS
jgi:hypothetical protein